MEALPKKKRQRGGAACAMPSRPELLGGPCTAETGFSLVRTSFPGEYGMLFRVKVDRMTWDPLRASESQRCVLLATAQPDFVTDVNKVVLEKALPFLRPRSESEVDCREVAVVYAVGDEIIGSVPTEGILGKVGFDGRAMVNGTMQLTATNVSNAYQLSGSNINVFKDMTGVMTFRPRNSNRLCLGPGGGNNCMPALSSAVFYPDYIPDSMYLVTLAEGQTLWVAYASQVEHLRDFDPPVGGDVLGFEVETCQVQGTVLSGSDDPAVWLVDNEGSPLIRFDASIGLARDNTTNIVTVDRLVFASEAQTPVKDIISRALRMAANLGLKYESPSLGKLVNLCMERYKGVAEKIDCDCKLVFCRAAKVEVRPDVVPDTSLSSDFNSVVNRVLRYETFLAHAVQSDYSGKLTREIHRWYVSSIVAGDGLGDRRRWAKSKTLQLCGILGKALADDLYAGEAPAVGGTLKEALDARVLAESVGDDADNAASGAANDNDAIRKINLGREIAVLCVGSDKSFGGAVTYGTPADDDWRSLQMSFANVDWRSLQIYDSLGEVVVVIPQEYPRPSKKGRADVSLATVLGAQVLKAAVRGWSICSRTYITNAEPANPDHMGFTDECVHGGFFEGEGQIASAEQRSGVTVFKPVCAACFATLQTGTTVPSSEVALCATDSFGGARTNLYASGFGSVIYRPAGEPQVLYNPVDLVGTADADVRLVRSADDEQVSETLIPGPLLRGLVAFPHPGIRNAWISAVVIPWGDLSMRPLVTIDSDTMGRLLALTPPSRKFNPGGEGDVRLPLSAWQAPVDQLWQGDPFSVLQAPSSRASVMDGLIGPKNVDMANTQFYLTLPEAAAGVAGQSLRTAMAEGVPVFGARGGVEGKALLRSLVDNEDPIVFGLDVVEKEYQGSEEGSEEEGEYDGGKGHEEDDEDIDGEAVIENVEQMEIRIASRRQKLLNDVESIYKEGPLGIRVLVLARVIEEEDGSVRFAIHPEYSQAFEGADFVSQVHDVTNSALAKEIRGVDFSAVVLEAEEYPYRAGNPLQLPNRVQRRRNFTFGIDKFQLFDVVVPLSDDHTVNLDGLAVGMMTCYGVGINNADSAATVQRYEGGPTVPLISVLGSDTQESPAVCGCVVFYTRTPESGFARPVLDLEQEFAETLGTTVLVDRLVAAPSLTRFVDESVTSNALPSSFAAGGTTITHALRAVTAEFAQQVVRLAPQLPGISDFALTAANLAMSCWTTPTLASFFASERYHSLTFSSAINANDADVFLDKVGSCFMEPNHDVDVLLRLCAERWTLDKMDLVRVYVQRMRNSFAACRQRLCFPLTSIEVQKTVVELCSSTEPDVDVPIFVAGLDLAGAEEAQAALDDDLREEDATSFMTYVNVPDTGPPVRHVPLYCSYALPPPSLEDGNLKYCTAQTCAAFAAEVSRARADLREKDKIATSPVAIKGQMLLRVHPKFDLQCSAKTKGCEPLLAVQAASCVSNFAECHSSASVSQGLRWALTSSMRVYILSAQMLSRLLGPDSVSRDLVEQLALKAGQDLLFCARDDAASKSLLKVERYAGEYLARCRGDAEAFDEIAALFGMVTVAYKEASADDSPDPLLVAPEIATVRTLAEASQKLKILRDVNSAFGAVWARVVVPARLALLVINLGIQGLSFVDKGKYHAPLRLMDYGNFARTTTTTTFVLRPNVTHFNFGQREAPNVWQDAEERFVASRRRTEGYHASAMALDRGMLGLTLVQSRLLGGTYVDGVKDPAEFPADEP